MLNDVNVIEKLVGFEQDTNGSLVMRESQFIPDEYLSALKRDKVDTLHTPMGDFYQVAEIPTKLVDLWKRQGFDVMREPIRDILARLRKHDLDVFITTNKRI
jgi:hypothetical protein